ncbi:NAD(P)H-hydrate dehydratase [Corynebacterium sputi]|uniref:NAD(P)H-hydrate dehydratase n=1 Tax=Corynebacterium sputi TaxID=489915 RepID=UPI0003F8CFA2|nr:NAD(P)H-hydrate dehydratase [Corynebacterium sputi]
MEPLYLADTIRKAEQPLIDAQSTPDALMRTAASSVARKALELVTRESARLVLLVGSGGNGGDALYAGADILNEMEAWFVDAVLCSDRIHEPALEAFREAGGRVIALDELSDYALAIDGIVGIGGSGPLRGEAADAVASLSKAGVPVLAVDVPSGIAADTGLASEPHVGADHTITFGGLRRAHGLSAHCGEVTLVDIGLDGQPCLGEILRGSEQDTVSLIRALEDPIEVPRLEPDPEDDKYTGGVVSICAGSATYPGAGVLTTTAAVRATSAMVRYIGSCREEVVRALPEVVAHDTIQDSGRCQAWVVGPGRGTDAAAASELRYILSKPEPVLIDADGLTLLANHPDLVESIRSREGATILTPHKGEFARIAAALALDLTADPITDTRAMAADLGAIVLLKGRSTVITTPEGTTTVVDAGCSWAATPGSGDVLSGLAGAWVARMGTSGSKSFEAVVLATVIHATAAYVAAQTEYGPAPTSASLIAEAIRPATAAVAV